MDVDGGRFGHREITGELSDRVSGRWGSRSWGSRSSDTNSSAIGESRWHAEVEKTLHEVHQEYQQKRNKPIRRDTKHRVGYLDHDDVRDTNEKSAGGLATPKSSEMEAFLSQFVSQQRDISHQIHRVQEKLQLIEVKVEQVDDRGGRKIEEQIEGEMIGRCCLEWANGLADRMVQACEKLPERLYPKRNGAMKSQDSSFSLPETAFQLDGIGHQFLPPLDLTSIEAFSECVSIFRDSSPKTQPTSQELADAIENCEKSFFSVLRLMGNAFKRQCARFDQALCVMQKKHDRRKQKEIEECKLKHKKQVEAVKHQMRIGEEQSQERLLAEQDRARKESAQVLFQAHLNHPDSDFLQHEQQMRRLQAELTSAQEKMQISLLQRKEYELSIQRLEDCIQEKDRRMTELNQELESIKSTNQKMSIQDQTQQFQSLHEQIQILHTEIAGKGLVGSEMSDRKNEEIIQRVGKQCERIWSWKIQESQEKSAQVLRRLQQQVRDFEDHAKRASTNHQQTQTRIPCRDACTLTKATETAVGVCQTTQIPSKDTPCSKTKCITQLRRQISVLEKLLYAKLDDGNRCICSQIETDTSSKSGGSSILRRSLLSPTHNDSAPEQKNAVNISFPAWKDQLHVENSSPELSTDSLPSIEAILALAERLETIRPESLQQTKATLKRERGKRSQNIGKSYTSATTSSQIRSCTSNKSSTPRQPPSKPPRASFRPRFTP
uniref:AlNc14C185G8302 protein n=1 Tax=Albugo laibachii Nc14 TaxID=890382 RepID=F0WPF7_9STRA|nr:AlNc14C185G8302 [Albugo laibachii Nc14]|eukprot:CCA23205.1 AlNc14C185G8302 [Albugo laibachii Nc14]